MVAITVAIAATVYVYVSGMISGPSVEPPTIIFTTDQDDDRIKLTTSDLDVSWGSLRIATSEDIVFFINDDATTAGEGIDLLADAAITILAAHINGGTMIDIAAGTFIDLAGGQQGAGADKTDVTITITHPDTNTVIGEYTFVTIAAAA